jgi:hypothetical protein
MLVEMIEHITGNVVLIIIVIHQLVVLHIKITVGYVVSQMVVLLVLSQPQQISVL